MYPNIRDMKNIKNLYLRIITIFSLFAILALQSVWLFNTFLLLKENIHLEITEILKNSMKNEAIYRMSQVFPSGTKVKGGKIQDDIMEITMLEEELYQLGHPISPASLHYIDSIATTLLNDYDINCEFVINMISTDTKNIIDKSKEDVEFSSDILTIQSRVIPIRTDLSQGIQLVILNPYHVMFDKMIFILLSTLVMVIFALYGLFHQMKAIHNERKINQLKEEFSYSIIHDMGTPLHIVLTCIKSLHATLEDKNISTQENYFQTIEKNLYDLMDFTNLNLTLFKLENDKLKINYAKVSLPLIIGDIQKKYLTNINNKSIVFKNELNTEVVYGDSFLLKEALINLIDNSIKYSKGPVVEITIRSLSDQRYNIIKVRDNGLGISKKEQQIIFNKFERGEALQRTLKDKGPTGFGLGLNYVYKIIQAHRGKVTLESIKDKFTEFTLYIPKIMK